MLGKYQSVSQSAICWNWCFMQLLLLLVVVIMASAAAGGGGGGSKVEFLPGFDGPLPFHLETGYIGVGEREDVQFFYYFIKSDKSTTSHHPTALEEEEEEGTPLVLWLSGGPGCSPFKALVYEIGPIAFEAVKYMSESESNSNNNSDVVFPKLVLNPNSWTKVANIIFLDMPVGTGFSYAKNPQALETTDLQSYAQVNEFLRKFLINHPEFIQNPFYVGGDSFAGLYVPVITQFVLDGNEIGTKPIINLKGYIIGNGFTSLDSDKGLYVPPLFVTDFNYKVPYAHGMGLIPDELYESLITNCKGEYQKPTNQQCVDNIDDFYQLVINIQSAHVLENKCESVSPQQRPPNYLFSQRRLLDQDLLSAARCHDDRYKYSDIWIGNVSVQEALHVRKGTIKQWVDCNLSLPFTITVKNVVPYFANLSRRGMRSLIYSGDHDMIVPFIATQAWIRSLKYSIIVDWHPWIVEGQVAGYTRTYSNQMTFATVKGAGHIAPEYKPLQCKSLFQRWISYQSL